MGHLNVELTIVRTWGGKEGIYSYQQETTVYTDSVFKVVAERPQREATNLAEMQKSQLA